MAIGVKTNVSSLMSQRHLNSTNRALQGNMAKLSSGFRINTAADDASGLAVSEEMKADIRSLNMASRNANDAISAVQTAEGSLNEVGNILGRMRELVVQANNGSLNNDQKSHIQTELQQLKIEIDDIHSRTTFNGKSLLDGSSMQFQVGIGGSDTVTFMAASGLSVSLLGRSSVGASGDAALTSIYVASGTFTTDDAGTTASVTAASVTGFSDALGAIDKAIGQISTQRAAFGALQNRLESKLDNLSIYRENIEAANSRIRDVDFASEMASMTKNQILMQAGTAMLAQANAMPQAALSLLG